MYAQEVAAGISSVKGPENLKLKRTRFLKKRLTLRNLTPLRPNQTAAPRTITSNGYSPNILPSESLGPVLKRQKAGSRVTKVRMVYSYNE